MPPRRTWLWFALILLANFLLVRFLFPGPEAPVEVPYTFFKGQVRAGNVEMIYSRGDTVEGRFEEPVTYPPRGQGGSEPSRTSKNFTAVLPDICDTKYYKHGAKCGHTLADRRIQLYNAGFF